MTEISYHPDAQQSLNGWEQPERTFECLDPACAERPPFDSLHGLQLHTRRAHDPEAEAVRIARTSEALRANAAAHRKQRDDETPEVFAILERSRDRSNTTEYDARRKRKRRAETAGLSIAEFEQAETERARRLVVSPEQPAPTGDVSAAAKAILNERFGSEKKPRDAYRKRLLDSQERGETPQQFELVEQARAEHLASGGKWTGTFIAASRRRVLRDAGLVATTVEVIPRQLSTAVEAATANDLFARLGRATDALFPNRVPSERILEVAEWQAQTLRMMQQ